MQQRSVRSSRSLLAGCVLLIACGGSTRSDPAGSGGAPTGGGGTVSGGSSGGGAPGGGAGGSGGSGATTAGGTGGVAGTSGSGGTPGADCAGLDYCACTSNAACSVISEPCFCPCGSEPCEPNCDCVCGGGKYLGCAPQAITNPGALDGIWLVGWSGGMNHFSWVRFEPNGKATYNDGAALVANLPLWPCSGEGSWVFTAKPNTVFLYMPAGCSATNNVITFEAFVGKPDWPKGCLLSANVTANPSSVPLSACKFPLSQCDASMSTCVDPMQ